MRAADATAQLVQLREPQMVSAIDDDGIRRRNVDAALDDRGARKHVEMPMIEIEHHVFERPLGHLAVRDSNVRLG